MTVRRTVITFYKMLCLIMLLLLRRNSTISCIFGRLFSFWKQAYKY
uniref:Uncharacterized protein n=1 Tax=Meloidogyne enterolobii TaxID=390850 RepID=A0A6V7TWP8_MELEN|nr:unnamed protein product [Meloidogyne enterolobii]